MKVNIDYLVTLKNYSMKRILFLGLLAVWFSSCGNSGSGTEGGSDTAKAQANPTTNSGAAGTGGVGAGFGTGGSPGTDTNTNPGAGGADTSSGGTRQ